MSAALDLALKKQRLQFRSAELRAELAGHGAALAPWFAAGDTLREGASWLRRHPEAIAAAAAVLAVVRPRAAFRWARRGVVAWQTWSRARAWLESRRREQ